jgi:hypothetical protein
MSWHSTWPAQRRQKAPKSGMGWKPFVAALRAVGVRGDEAAIRMVIAAAGVVQSASGYTAEQVETVRAYAARSGRKKQQEK